MKVSNDIGNLATPLQSQKLNQQLATGKAVNNASDDAAALQIINRLSGEIEGFARGIRNLNDGLSTAQVSLSGLQGVSEAIQRTQELAIQSGSGILSDSDRASIQNEITQLQNQVKDFAANTNIGGVPLLNIDGELNFGTGKEGGGLNVTTKDIEAGLIGAGFFNVDVTDPGQLDSILSRLSDSNRFISDVTTELAAQQSAFESEINNLGQSAVNAESARSRLQDTDFAATAAERAKQDFRQQAEISVFKQANANRQQVLSLLS